MILIWLQCYLMWDLTSRTFLSDIYVLDENHYWNISGDGQPCSNEKLPFILKKIQKNIAEKWVYFWLFPSFSEILHEIISHHQNIWMSVRPPVHWSRQGDSDIFVACQFIVKVVSCRMSQRSTRVLELWYRAPSLGFNFQD